MKVTETVEETHSVRVDLGGGIVLHVRGSAGLWTAVALYSARPPLALPGAAGAVLGSAQPSPTYTAALAGGVAVLEGLRSALDVALATYAEAGE